MSSHRPVSRVVSKIETALLNLDATLATFYLVPQERWADRLLPHLTLLRDLGMSEVDLQVHIERGRAINSQSSFVNDKQAPFEEASLLALDMVTGAVGNPKYKVYQPYPFPTMSDSRAAHPFGVYCQQEKCGVCGELAAHKVEEVSGVSFHPLTTYLCCAHFREVMGPAHDQWPYSLQQDSTTP